MTLAHLIYIPGVLLVGLVLGYTMGSRAARSAADQARRRSRR